MGGPRARGDAPSTWLVATTRAWEGPVGYGGHRSRGAGFRIDGERMEAAVVEVVPDNANARNMKTHTFTPPGTNLSPRLERNRRGRDLVVGHIHGHFATLRRALAELEVGEHDRVFSLGDRR